MTLQFGDRTSGDGMIHCRRCGHGIVLRDGDSVPRCYCGGEEFEEPRARSTRAAPRSPRAMSAAPRHESTRDESTRGDSVRGDPPR